MVSPREFLLAILLPAALCLLAGVLGARLRAGGGRRALQAGSAALAGLICFRAGPDCVRLVVLPLALLAAWGRAPHELLALLACLGLLFARLAAPPGWVEGALALFAGTLVWALSRRTPASFPAWRPLLALATFGGAVAFACLAGRSASLALSAAGVATAAGAVFAASLRWPAWSCGRPGFDALFFCLAGALASAVYLGELAPLAALVLLASIVAPRIPAFALGFAAQLALTALALWIGWPAGGFGA